MPIQDYSTDPDLNVQISGINIAEGCPPSGINNAIRQLMADVKEESEAKAEAIAAAATQASSALEAYAEGQAQKDAAQDAAIAGKLDKSGGTMTGWLRFAYGRISSSTDVKALEFRAFTDEYYGASLVLKNLSAETYPGEAIIQARDSDGTPGENIRFLADGSIVIADEKVLTDAQGLPVSTGIVVPFAANTVPDGFLLCNGAAVSRATYAKLFNVIGTTYGTGDGSTTFNLPNLTDRFIQGSGTAGTVKAAGLPGIYGWLPQVLLSANNNLIEGAFTPTEFGSQASGSTSGSENRWTRIGFDAGYSNSLYGASSTVQPPALTMRYYIKY